MKDLRFFETEADYKNASIEYPNVSYTKDSEDVWIIDNPNKIIMTSESNPAAMEVCYLQGWAANENYMTKAEAEAVTDIGTAFKNAGNDYGVTMKELYSFNEFKYFTNITSISDGAFTSCSSLSSITIPNSVTSIGASAFSACDLLSSIDIPNSVTSIGNGAFRYCSSLSEITIGNSVTSIGTQAFYGCPLLSSITIGNSVTSIGDDVFRDCSSLSSITIPNSVTSIGANAFYYCDSLSSIICLAETAPTILSNTFRYICSNGVLKVPSGSDYSSWMSTSSYYLGYYNWTKEEI